MLMEPHVCDGCQRLSEAVRGTAALLPPPAVVSMEME